MPEEEITCEFGYYPYCPLCEHGYERQEEWMREDECEWVCLLVEEQKRKEQGSGLHRLHPAGRHG